MTHQLFQQLRKIGVGIAICVVGLVMMVLTSACAGISGSNNVVRGSISSVNAQNHTVTLNFNGQSITISGLTDQQVAQLQSQVGKTFSLQATQNSDGTYTIVAGSNITHEDATPSANKTETPGSNDTTNAREPGNIQFIGSVQSVGNGSIVVKMPDGSSLSMSVNAQTENSDFNGAQPGVGQFIKVKATANTDGSFSAAELKSTDNSDPQDKNTVEYQGITTSAVGSDGFIHFGVGNKSYSFHIGAGADLSDFNNNAQSISNNQAVKVKVVFQGATGSITKVSK
ncbi:MAG TPA: DUF5666 domain-containing protein [Ktedonobacteraceae bacterium]|nr:DUF5666 domain-containing protein [Ktedonobacteraceae bacterium]